MAKSGETRAFRSLNSSPDCAVEIWDTTYLPPAQAFGLFRDGVRRSFMPWQTEVVDDRAFEARLESVRFDDGLIGRIRSTPTQGIRTKAHIAESEVECVYASLRLFGDAAIKQGDKFVVARPGDLVIFDSVRPTVHTSLGELRLRRYSAADPKKRAGCPDPRQSMLASQASNYGASFKLHGLHNTKPIVSVSG